MSQERASKLSTIQPCMTNFQTDAPSVRSVLTCGVEQDSDPEITTAKADSSRPKGEARAFRGSCIEGSVPRLSCDLPCSESVLAV